MQPKGKPETNKASSKAQTPPSQTSSPERETLQALVQRVSKLHYGCIDDAAIQYMQRIANKLHHHSQVPIRVSSIKEWMANLQTGTLLYGVNTIAPSLSFQLSKLLQRLSKEQEAGLKQRLAQHLIISFLHDSI